jgi:hypothetical protein
MLLQPKKRRFFEDKCLHVGDPYRYRRRCEQIHKSWKRFDPRPTAEWMADDDAAKEHFATEQQVNELKSKVGELQKAFVYWLAVLVLVAAIAAWRG